MGTARGPLDRDARRVGERLPRGTTARAGFTLVEMLVVFVIVAAAGALAVPAFRALYQESDIEVATRKVEVLLRLARDSALRSGRPVTVVLDSVSGLVWLDSPAAEPIDREPPGGLIGGILSASRSSGAAGTSAALRVSRAGWSGTGETVEPGTDLELPPGFRLDLTSARARFRFLPTGAAYGDSIFIDGGGAVRLITVDPATGNVVRYGG